MATPLEIDIALWYYTRPGDYGEGMGDHNFKAPAVQEALKRFVDAGLLKAHEPNSDLPQLFHNTEGLRVYVETLCNVPWPEQRWVVPSMEHAERGAKGGHARAAALSPERRSEIASAAAGARWNGSR